MTWIAETLWDLLRPAPRRPARPPAKRPSPDRSSTNRPAAPPRPIQARYDRLVADMKARYGLRVRKWRSSTSGCAWEVRYEDGTVARLIESPYPRGPMSCAVFLHEVGHHAIGLRTYAPRCLEEYEAWRWSLAAMREHGFNVTPAVEKRMHDAIRYAVAKAQRRGLRRVPEAVAAYLAAGPGGEVTRPSPSPTPPIPSSSS